MKRFYLCDLINLEGKKKTAYIPEKDAKIGSQFNVKGKAWKIESVGKLSVSEEILKKIQGTEKIGYREKK